MSLKIGQRVKLIDDSEEGVVQSLSHYSAIVLFDHGFEEEVALTELIPALSFSPGDTVHKVELDNSGQRSKPKAIKKKEKYEIDLHAGSLIGNTSGMSNHEIVLMQLDEAVKGINSARKQGYTHAVLIHGKGSGKLKSELMKRLNQIERIEVYDAEYRRYSHGATEVKFY